MCGGFCSLLFVEVGNIFWWIFSRKQMVSESIFQCLLSVKLRQLLQLLQRQQRKTLASILAHCRRLLMMCFNEKSFPQTYYLSETHFIAESTEFLFLFETMVWKTWFERQSKQSMWPTNLFITISITFSGALPLTLRIFYIEFRRFNSFHLIFDMHIHSIWFERRKNQ